MKAPELILTNGKVYSVKLNDEIVRGEAVAVREGQILKIGNKEEIKMLKAKTEAIKANEERDRMYAEAIEAMRRYTPHSAEEY